MNSTRCYLNATGLICSAGDSVEELKRSFMERKRCLTSSGHFINGLALPLGLYLGELPDIPLPHKAWQTRNNQFALAAVLQVEGAVKRAIKIYGAERIGVVIGTSTSGISEAEQGLFHFEEHKELSDKHHYSFQEMGNTAQFIGEVLGVKGPVYAVSTACSSGAKALAAGRRLIRAGFCDVVVVGGVDTLCKLTVQGFSSLGAVSHQQCNPFSVNRNGINIGEAAALFIISAEESGVELLGVGEGSDAYHISAPDPSGDGAARVMMDALNDGNVSPAEVDYVNLHGTATVLNDQMEAKALDKVFGSSVLCSSTKPFTGHTLGAAGAIEAAICVAALADDGFVPPHLWDGVQDSELPVMNFADDISSDKVAMKYVLSNSFAFGGNNISLLLGRN